MCIAYMLITTPPLNEHSSPQCSVKQLYLLNIFYKSRGEKEFADTLIIV